MKKILVINGHPNKQSFCDALSKAYTKGALKAGNAVVLINLYDLQFNPNFEGTYTKENTGVEADIIDARKKISEAQHLVIIHPVWWGSVPALLKGFFDKTLVPGFAFKYKKNSPMWDKLLKGKTAEIIYTTDTPVWFYRLFYRAPSVNMVRDRVLGFCGVKTKQVIGIGPIRNSTLEFREKWLKKIENLH
ncbi:MAG: NAD(P)H-dependent oxidoreductase [Bacteroidia bacterium]|nr:NAD(P)H-dependent oxidoreductase [Bacteroidia bacterium]